MGSYTSHSSSWWSVVGEGLALYRLQRRQAAQMVCNALEHVHRVEGLLNEQFGVALRGRDVLEIGAGQFLLQMQCFGVHNRVVGIDFDVIAQGFSPGAYYRMLRHNGLKRTTKTLARKLLGIDRRCRAEFMAQTGVTELPRRDVIRMDACDLRFPDASFDFVHCLSVFHHLPRPEAAVAGIKRVLRPGGTVYLSFHLYTSETGSLDPRVFAREAGGLPRWSHLRPDYAEAVRSSAYLNKLRLPQWRALFAAHMPGAVVLLNPTARPGAEADVRSLHAAGELRDYSEEELLTHSVAVLWQKPTDGSGAS